MPTHAVLGEASCTSACPPRLGRPVACLPTHHLPPWHPSISACTINMAVCAAVQTTAMAVATHLPCCGRLFSGTAGITSVAVVLKHAAIYPAHEQLVGQLARDMGFAQASAGCFGLRCGQRAACAPRPQLALLKRSTHPSVLYRGLTVQWEAPTATTAAQARSCATHE